MKHWLREIVGDKANCFTGTFHGYCNMFLKEEIHKLSFPKTFTILDKKAQAEMIKNVDRKSTRLNSSHYQQSRMPSSA